MVRNRLTGTTALAVLAAATIWPAEARADGVNIIYPPKLDVQAQLPAQREMAARKNGAGSTVNIVVIDRSFFKQRDRARAVKRALGHRYLGFIKTYSGPRYPSDL